MTPAENEKEIKDALEIFMRLPQAMHISEHQVNDFIQAVVDIGESPVWHMRRLASIGPSEAGFLVATYMNANRGVDEPFISTMKDARDIVLQKLMRVLPEEVPATRRGKRMEKTARQFFIEDLESQGYQVQRAESELQALRDARGKEGTVIDPEHPWLPVPSIDDLLYVTDPKTEKKRLVLPDYKCPSVDMFHTLNQDVGIPYKVQLHLYRYGLNKLGISIDEMGLAPFNYEDASVPFVEVEYDPNLEATIFKACDAYYYNSILSGNVPPRVSTALEAYDPKKVPDEAYLNAALYAAASAAEEESASLKRAAQLALKETFKDIKTMKQTSVSLGPTNVSLKPVFEYDTNELYKLAEELGVNITEKDSDAQVFKKVEKQVASSDLAVNLDNIRAVTHMVTVRVASGNKAGAHLMRGIKQDAVPLVGGALDQLQSDLSEIMDVIADSAMTEKDRIDYVAQRNEAILGLGKNNKALIQPPTKAPPHEPRTVQENPQYERDMQPPSIKDDCVISELNSDMGVHERKPSSNSQDDEFINALGGVRM